MMFAAHSVMAVVLISWVSMSLVFCLALVRAAARRCVQTTNQAEEALPAAESGLLKTQVTARVQPQALHVSAA